MAKKLTLVYFSATQTTKRNLCAMAQGTGLPFEQIDFTLPQNRTKNITFGSDDFVIFGSPVYGGVMPLLVRNYLKDHVKGKQTPCTIVAVYGNRDFDDCLAEMEDLLTENGFIVTSAAACLGEHSFTTEVATGRPDKKDIAWATEFGKQLVAKIDAPAKALEKGVIPGNRPYKERKPSPAMAPATTNGCLHCGMCAQNCPVGAIDIDRPDMVNGEKCIRCLACVRLCPIGSKVFIQDAFKSSVQKCIEGFKNPRKEPVAFL